MRFGISDLVQTFPSAYKAYHTDPLDLFIFLDYLRMQYSIKSSDNIIISGMEDGDKLKGYWRENLKYVGYLLTVWFVVSFGFGIFLAEPLNTFEIAGFKLGFWFAQQGSIYVFVILIFVYVWLMNRLDREYGLYED